MKKVMIFGTFDYFHAGHEAYINQARQFGDYVIAVIARDKTVQKVKSKTPDQSERKRLKILRDSRLVDKAVLGNLTDKHKVILKHKPDIIALGYDQFAFTFRLEKTIIEHNLSTEIVRMKPYRPDLYKSSIIKEKQMMKKSSAQQPLSLLA